MGESEVMIEILDIQLFTKAKPLGKVKLGEPFYVRLTDHVAGVNAATASALQEEAEAYDHGYCIGYAAGYSRGISGIGKGLGDYCQVDECAGCGE